ncbi:MAG: CoA transferase [Dehalococcoidia bacterium]|nr:CoA transferase [Dehalococcoidia bacterium]
MSRFNWLTGIRVLELTTAWAGPAVGRFLGALGADVVKVESARRYDLWRGSANANPPDRKGAHVYNLAPNFNGLNRNKRGISLDLTAPGGREMFLRLVQAADAIVTNLTARVLPNLGLDYGALRQVNPRIILLNMPALGASGPNRDLAGYGSIIEGMGGMAVRFGHASEGARVSQTFYPDAVAGVHAVVALLAGLNRRDRDGHGLSIDLSQQETMWLQLGEGIVLHSLEGREPERMGNAEPGLAPSGVFPTLDSRWVALVVKSDEQFAALVQLAHPKLRHFARWETTRRLANRMQLESAVGSWTATLPLAGLLEAFTERDIAAAAVNNYAEAAVAPCFADLDALERIAHPEAGTCLHLRMPVRFDGQCVDTRLPGVRFGEHTDLVLKEWVSASRKEIEGLRAGGAVVDEIPATL